MGVQVANWGPLCAREGSSANVFEDPVGPAEQRDGDGKAELLILCLAFNIGDPELALVFAEGHNVQPCRVRGRKDGSNM